MGASARVCGSVCVKLNVCGDIHAYVYIICVCVYGEYAVKHALIKMIWNNERNNISWNFPLLCTI